MKAIRLVRPGSPLELQDIPVPQVGCSDVRVRVKAAGVCHSDVHYRAGRSRVHLAADPGHEVAGVIEQLGVEVLDLVKRRQGLYSLHGDLRPLRRFAFRATTSSARPEP